ncbi:MAG: permease-like cell division protein FtsX [Oscillospiraceae bacterium]|nr:permease-like cell division protein FtsX [Oscillospiraceae bacterium]
MKASSVKYLAGEGVRNIGSNRLMSLASIGVLTACLLLIGAAWLVSINANAIVGYVEDQNEAMAFVEDRADYDDIIEIEEQLKQIENIHEVIYVSKAQALEQQMELLEENAFLFEEFEKDNPYPDSFRLKIDDLSRLAETIEQVEGIDGIDGTSASLDLAVTITDIKNGISFAGLAIVAMLSLVSLVIVANTIKITVFNRRKEISIMKYVGATDLFIRLPFFVEGLILGLISAVVSFLLLWGGYELLLNWMGGTESSWFMMAFEHLVSFEQVALKMLIAFVAAGMSIGGLGSMMFMGKHLKV